MKQLFASLLDPKIICFCCQHLCLHDIHSSQHKDDFPTKHYQIWLLKCYKRLACANLILFPHLQIINIFFHKNTHNRFSKKKDNQRFFGNPPFTPFNPTNPTSFSRPPFDIEIKLVIIITREVTLPQIVESEQ